MLAHAETLGCAIPTCDFDGIVHSVFRRACNVQIWGGGLITLLDSKLGKLPQGITLSLPDTFSFESAGFHRDQLVTCRDGSLRIDSLPIEINLNSSIRWRADLQSHLIDLHRPAVHQAWAVAHAEWQQVPEPTDVVSIKARSIIRATLPRLSRAFRAYDLESSRQQAARLIGLGFGLTPSGDDALVGFLAGLWSTPTTTAQQSFLTAFGQEVISLSSRTNDISRAYLIHAAHGQVSSILENLCHAITRGAPADEIRHATHAALAVGHTSGADGVGGLLLSLRTLPPQHHRIVPSNRSFSVFSVSSVD